MTELQRDLLKEAYRLLFVLAQLEIERVNTKGPTMDEIVKMSWNIDNNARTILTCLHYFDMYGAKS